MACANALTNDVTSQRNYGSGGVELVEFTLNGSNSRNHILEPFSPGPIVVSYNGDTADCTFPSGFCYL